MIAAHVPLLGVDVWEHVYNSVLTVLSRAISDSSNTTFLLGLGILPAIQKRAARLSQSNLVCGQLEDRRRKVCKGTMTGIIIHNKGTKVLFGRCREFVPREINKLFLKVLPDIGS